METKLGNHKSTSQREVRWILALDLSRGKDLLWRQICRFQVVPGFREGTKMTENLCADDRAAT